MPQKSSIAVCCLSLHHWEHEKDHSLSCKLESMECENVWPRNIKAYLKWYYQKHSFGRE